MGVGRKLSSGLTNEGEDLWLSGNAACLYSVVKD